MKFHFTRHTIRLLLIILSPLSVWAQAITDVVVKQTSPGTLTVTFRPSTQFNRDQFLVVTYEVQDSSDFSRTEVTTVSGTDAHISAYKDQYTITWNYGAAGFNFNPQQMAFVVKGKLYPVGGGPANALWSVLIPGLGDAFVSATRKKSGLPFTFATLGCMGIGGLLHSSANRAYSEYESARFGSNGDEATLQIYLNEKFTYAESQMRNAQIFYTLGAAIWLIDIARVAIKGGENNKYRAGKPARISFVPGNVQMPGLNIAALTFKYTF